ncbi:MAG: macrolide family glycosyltransferase [Lachnospiraceae bacterium]
MKNIMVFCIPAHGHHNPTFPVVTELVKRGNAVRYYSFEEFREKIEKTGAEFIACDSFLPELSEEQMKNMKKVSTTEMTIVDLQTTAKMDSFLKKQVEEFRPDVIFTDSVCFWGKLTARKYKIPMVVSTTTFAFNKFSSKYMKNSFSEIIDLIKGTKRVNAELKKLEQYGYYEKSIMPLIQNDNDTDTIVYATEKYQPCSETFSKHYAFVGPSVFSNEMPDKNHERPLIYISLGTVVNEKPDFYQKCIRAFKGENVEVIISCGNAVDPKEFGELPENIKIYQRVDQLSVLSRANVFLTYCGMNSVSESLYMAAPMVLFPQTNEQRAVARRAEEMGAGILLKKDSEEEIKNAVLMVLNDKQYAEHAMECSRDFRGAPGPQGAAEFIESAPHLLPEEIKK